MIALWASQIYLIGAFAVTTKLCFDQLRAFFRGAAEASAGGIVLVSISPAWVVTMADASVARLWWLLLATGFGILLTALSTVWISVSSQRPAAER
jgi:hypothetical protein